MFRTIVFIISLSILTGGCASLMKDLIPSLLGKDKGGLSVDAQIGDKEMDNQIGNKGTGDIKTDDGNVTVDTDNSKKSSNVEGNVEKVEVNNGPTFWYILLLVLGWILPTPSEMWKQIKGSFPYVK